MEPVFNDLLTPDTRNWTLVLWVQEPQRRQGNRQLGNFDDLVVAAQKPIRLLRFKTCKRQSPTQAMQPNRYPSLSIKIIN